MILCEKDTRTKNEQQYTLKNQQGGQKTQNTEFRTSTEHNTGGKNPIQVGTSNQKYGPPEYS